MNIVGVDVATFGIEEMNEARRFFADLGLQERDGAASGASLLALDGSEVRLRNVADGTLPQPVAGGSTVREVVWGVADDAALQAIASELQRDRPVALGSDGVLRATDAEGYGIGFRVAQRRPFEPAAVTLNVYGRAPLRATNVRIDFAEPPRPATIGHVVLFAADVASATRFYVERLGFRVTDSFRGSHGAFLRCAGSSDHHTLFLIRNVQGGRGLHHLSFHLPDFNAVMLLGKRLTERGWTTKFGPGRHVIGSNCFWYFHSPCGGAMELSCDMDRADDGWEVREWDFSPQNVAAWSVAFTAPGR